MALTEVRLRPIGPWRVGHHAGDKERVDVIYRSDALFSAITHAMRVLGWMDEWLDATARAEGAPAVRLSSLFPFIGKTRLITPPKSTWPPANAGKLYLQGIRLVPLDVAKGAAIDESRWTADGASECLVPSGASSPFHVSVRTAGAVDRFTGAVEPHRTACLEFAPNAGWWGVYEASDSKWDARVKAAFRLLADSGFGGERSRGWGRASEPQFSTASSLFPQAASDGAWWLLSLYSPHEGDGVDWAKGSYSAVVRGGWTDSPAGSGQKKSVRMIEEGSVLMASALRGKAVDVAPEGFGHPVYRNGLGLAVGLGTVAEESAPVGQVSDLPDSTPDTLPVADVDGQAEAPVPPEESVPVGQVSDLPDSTPDTLPVADVDGQAEAPVPPEESAPVGQVSDLPDSTPGTPPVTDVDGQAEAPVPPEESAPVGQVSDLPDSAPDTPPVADVDGQAEAPVPPEESAPVGQVSDLPDSTPDTLPVADVDGQAEAPVPPEESAPVGQVSDLPDSTADTLPAADVDGQAEAPVPPEESAPVGQVSDLPDSAPDTPPAADVDGQAEAPVPPEESAPVGQVSDLPDSTSDAAPVKEPLESSE